MARTSVSRRLVYVKKTKKPVAPLPKRSQSSEKSEQMVGEKAKPIPVFAAPPPRASKQSSGAMKLAKFAAAFVGVVCVGAAVAVMSNSRPKASSDYVEPEVRTAVSRPAPSRTVDADPGLQGNALPTVLAQRSAPTDESFRASAHARRR